jgi:hypothetical protein
MHMVTNRPIRFGFVGSVMPCMHSLTNQPREWRFVISSRSPRSPTATGAVRRLSAGAAALAAASLGWAELARFGAL